MLINTGEKEDKSASFENPQGESIIDSNPLEEDENSNLTKEIRSKELAAMVQKNHDNDLDSLENTSEAYQKPSNVKMHDDNNSVASSLTNESLQSQETTISKLSIESQGTNASLISAKTNQSSNSSSSSKRSSYELTSSMVEKIGIEAIKEGLSPDELEKRIQSYQELKFNEAS